ncbi:MAG: hypothetical protein AB3N33_13145 [Puniceicoccaceae bacterium]
MKSFKFILLAFVSGALVGGITSLYVRTSDAEETVPGKSSAQDQGVASYSEDDRAVLLKRIRDQEAEIAVLKARNLSGDEPETDVAEENPEEAEQNARRDFFRSRMEERMNQRVEEMVLNLGLNDGQRQLLQEVYRQQFENIRARRSGEEVAPFNFDGAVESILTPEQFEQYLETSQQEIYNRAELMATTQMVRLSQSVELTSEQEGLVYDAIHFTAQEAMISRQTGSDYNMREVVNERLSTILTEEQFKAYQESGAGFGGGPGRGRGGFPPP